MTCLIPPGVGGLAFLALGNDDLLLLRNIYKDTVSLLVDLECFGWPGRAILFRIAPFLGSST